MSDFDAAVDALVSTSFATFGKLSTFTPAVGSPVPNVKVILDRPDVEIVAGEARMILADAVMSVAIAALPAAPKVGDRFTVAALNYYVMDKPRVLDDDRKVWSFPVEERDGV